LQTGVDVKGVKMSLNPFCEIALEEAVRLKEYLIADEVVAMTIGPKQWSETLRNGLSIGADRGIHIVTNDDQAPRQLGIARAIAAVAKIENPDMIIVGKQSIDDDANQTGQMVAGLLQWPQGTFASKMEVDKERKSVRVEREVDVVELKLPAVITSDLRLNIPRYASLKNIMASRKKVLQELSPKVCRARQYSM